MTVKTQNIFSSFTNLYELSKTLRFELKPIGNTQNILNINKVFEKDEEKAKNYKEAKKYFDELHREFIDKALTNTKLPINLYESFEKSYFSYKKDKNQKNKIDFIGDNGKGGIAKKLRTVILNNFNDEANKWKDEYSIDIEEVKRKKIKKINGMELFFKVEIFDLLRKKYPEAKINDKSIFDPFNKFSGYFKRFHETRRNFYKDDGSSSAIPTRIINNNLPRFLENIKIFKEKYHEKYSSLFGEEEREIFTLGYFNKCFTQEQIDIYNNKIASLKSKINTLRQNNQEIKTDLPFFKTFFKQILGKSSKNETEEYNFIEITEDQEVFPRLGKFIDENKKYIPKAITLFERFIKNQKQELDDFNIEEIYVANRFINTISNKWFMSWDTLRTNLFKVLNLKGQEKLSDFISMANLKVALCKSQLVIDVKDFFREDYEKFFNAENDFYQIFLKIWEEEFNSNIKKYINETNNIETMIKKDKTYQPNKKEVLKDGKEGSIQKEVIKEYVDTVMSIYQMMKYFSLEKGKEREWNAEGLNEDMTGGFYEDFKEYYENVYTWKYFNELRNYLTRKPYNRNKIKLNFECSSLLGGWSKTYESSGALIFEKNDNYYLGIINGVGFNKEETISLYKNRDEKNSCKRIIYDFQKPDFKNFPRLFIRSKGSNFAPAVKKYNLPIQSVLNIYDRGLYKIENKDNPNYLSSLTKMIDYFKLGITRHESYKYYNFQWKNSDMYENISDFYRDVIHSCYKISRENINFDQLKKLIEKNRVYLFQIYNKDFELDENIAPGNYLYKGKQGNKNLHTLYWKALFSENNLAKTVLKLNGEAEIFYRKGSLKPVIDKNRKTKIEIIKNNRFTKNKIFLHCSITLNFSKNKIGISTEIRKTIKNNPKVNIIGIDRGEKHLAYYCIINQKGEILDLDSFNKIKEQENREPTDYHKKLDVLEKDRDLQRKSWQEIVNIKEMKKGYVSQVVHQICKLINKYNAIVVFEDLNIGFKRGRFAIEKQIYQNLELALIKKLNYLVFKNAKEGEAGNYLQAYQLTPPIDNFKDIHKQCGVVFYVPASYTSAICPICGFRKNISTPNENLEKNKELLNKFDIFYEKDNDRFCFSYKKSDFYQVKNNEKNKKIPYLKLFEEINLSDESIFYSNVERLEYKRNKNNHGGEVKDINPNQKIKELLINNEINYKNTLNISEQIKKNSFGNESFYRPFIHVISLILQLRNSRTGTINRDFILCPHCYFHSEKNLLELYQKYKGEKEFEFNGDANGAYNIARKGSLILQKIKKMQNIEKVGFGDLSISQEEFDKSFSQKLQ